MADGLPALVAELAPQVGANCDLASAMGSGRFSLCGLLLRLRNLYKWEQGLAPWQEEESGRMLDWVAEREDRWAEILDQEFSDLELAGQSIDPFDHQTVNRIIEDSGYVYGAGLAGGLIPAFFLAKCDAKLNHNGLTVYRLGRELCHDIFLLPGMRQDNNIFLRADPMPFLLWDRLADPTPSLKVFCDMGLAGYGLDREALLANPTREAMAKVMDGEMDGVLWHELGEAVDGALASAMLEQVVEQHGATELEHFVRGVKDLLADTGPRGRIARIMEARHMGMMGLYPVWLAGFPRLLFPEMDQAVEALRCGGDWSVIEEARQIGWERANQAVMDLTPILAHDDVDQVRKLAHDEVIAPLTEH